MEIHKLHYNIETPISAKLISDYVLVISSKLVNLINFAYLAIPLLYPPSHFASARCQRLLSLLSPCNNDIAKLFKEENNLG